MIPSASGMLTPVTGTSGGRVGLTAGVGVIDDSGVADTVAIGVAIGVVVTAGLGVTVTIGVGVIAGVGVMIIVAVGNGVGVGPFPLAKLSSEEGLLKDIIATTIPPTKTKRTTIPMMTGSIFFSPEFLFSDVNTWL